MAAQHDWIGEIMQIPFPNLAQFLEVETGSEVAEGLCADWPEQDITAGGRDGRVSASLEQNGIQ